MKLLDINHPAIEFPIRNGERNHHSGIKFYWAFTTFHFLTFWETPKQQSIRYCICFCITNYFCEDVCFLCVLNLQKKNDNFSIIAIFLQRYILSLQMYMKHY